MEKLDPLQGFFICPGCAARVEALGRCGERACERSLLDGQMTGGAYADPFLRELLRAWKYERVPEAGEVIVDALWKFSAVKREAVRSTLDAATVVATPIHPFREALRGFDQAAALAEAVAQGLGVPYRRGALEKRWRLRTQVGTGDHAARQLNAARSVQAVGAAPRVAVVVDDVATTGATLEACAAALRAAGTERVYGVTFLHG